ncbi:50S ribosomal protein L24 [Candidatus Woesebacteria bacterium]|jgi:large subunit ribosomal protein L24|nr:50S ribosomal protein L24 [Candidatus Woesebacteria bacterium]HNV45216.1 50S ribosomal protein L24 [Candidatus Woesebacteria bacterium]HOA11711.1 50S ribosomal protein L24 [Candidatus Woesebacteria bacterium]HOC07322.1 50S ribosomal protein L24 [Candidatus Woesebacteria bacterium]HOI05024.1 50S ribosomal protein L24 [Candidatus Woesebacteria bacterium]
MKFKIGDRVLITAGKDKGKKSVIVGLLPKQNKVIVKDVNLYYKHVKPFMDKPGEKRYSERPLPLAKVAILNDQDQVDRLAYRRTADGQKERFFKKTGQLAKVEKVEKAVKEDKKAKKIAKKSKKEETAIVEDSQKLAQEAIKVEKKSAKKATSKLTKITRIRKTQDKG